MTIQTMAIIIAGVLLLWGAKIFFGPRKNLVKGPCKKLWDAAVAAGKRYEKIRKLVIDQINERNQLKEEIKDIEGQKRKCEEEYQKQREEFNESGVTLVAENSDAWWKERRRMKDALNAKEEECKLLGDELERKRRRLHDLEGRLTQGLILEELSRETYPEALKKYRECEKRQKEKEEVSIDESEEPCCPSGLWIGIVGREGGELAIAGLESGVVYLMCLDNLDVTATLKWRGIRVGPGLGGGTGVELIFMKGPEYPCKIEEQVANILGGVGFDLSAGPSFADYLEGIAKSGGRLTQALDGASGAKDKFGALTDFLKGSGSAVKDGLKQRASAGGGSATSSGFTGLTFPLGGSGLNVGLWYTIPETCELISWAGCKACDE